MSKPGLQRKVQSSNKAPPKSMVGKVVIGIDLGTTKCCVAYGTTPKRRNKLNTPVYKGWAGCRGQSFDYPITALYYESGSRPKTGNALATFLKSPKEIDTDRYFHLWKWLFHGDQDDPSVIKVQKESRRKLEQMGKTREDLLRDWVEVTYRELFKQNSDGEVLQPVQLKHLHDDRNLAVEIVIAVPPGRDGMVHEEVLQCFLQFGITESQVCLVSEPEAMFRSWVTDGEGKLSWKVGKRYLVADGGGGTTCLVRYKLVGLKPPVFEQEFKSQSLLSAAESISNSFMEIARKKIPVGITHQKTEHFLHCLRCDFEEQYKFHFGENGDDKAVYPFRAPWNYNVTFEFSHSEIAECFQQCISRLVNGIREQCSQGEPVDYLVLGGGLFNSRYVENAIEKIFPNLNVCDLSDDKSHVARGCVLTRFNSGPDGFIVRRPILQSKGLATWMQVTNEIRNAHFFSNLIVETGPYDGKTYFWAVQWLAKGADGRQLVHAGNRYEVESESTFQKARKREFWTDADSPQFKDTIFTVSCHPGNDTWAAFRKDDEKLMGQNGNLLPGEWYSEKLEWNPRKLGVPDENLETEIGSKNRLYKTIRYSISMEMKEVGTKYMIKAWSLEGSNAKDPKKRTTVYSEAYERQFSDGHQISQNLLKSLELEDQFRGEAIHVNDTTVSSSQNHNSHDSNMLVPMGTTSATTAQESQRESSGNGPVVLHQPLKSLKRSASSQGFRSPSQTQPSRSPLGVVNPSQQQVVEPNGYHPLDSRGETSRKPKSAGSRTTQQSTTHNASIIRAPIAPMFTQPTTTSTQEICPSIEDDIYGASPPPQRRPADKNDAARFR